MRDGQPDMTLLGVLVGAWSRSHFLCKTEVTDYLRKLWLDAVRASYLHGVMTGEAQGDHGEAVKEFHALLREHADYDKLRAKFMSDLRVYQGLSWQKYREHMDSTITGAAVVD